MKRAVYLYPFGIIFLFLLVNSCKKDKVEEPVVSTTITTIADLNVPASFNYETSKKVSVMFSDFKMKSTNHVKYDIYLYDDQTSTETITYDDEEGNSVTATVLKSDVLNNKIATKITDQASFTLDFTIPEYSNSLYVIRNEMGVYSTSIIQIVNSKALYSRSEGYNKSTTDVVDILYGVNGGGDLTTINHSTGEMVVISQLPDNTGSYTCAINDVTRKLYTVGHTKYLYCYDIDAGTWTTVGYVGIGGPRLGYNKIDGLLYFSTGRYVYTIDPSNATILSTYTISGLQTTSGGDLTFDSDGTMYISSTTGLYRCEFTSGNTISTTWISSESLPNYPNSLTFDSGGELFWATNTAGKGRVFIMDKVTGGWQDKFSPFNTRIHDLALLPYDQTAVPEVDTDGDGIIDFYDEFPDDVEKAAQTYTPSIYGWGTYAFEDLWPYKGDYDFNDLVLNYRYTNIENAQGLVVETKLNFLIKNIGGSFKNGFGIEIDMSEALIENVTGYNMSENIVSLNSKGLENSQSKPVIIAFENAWALSSVGEIELTIDYLTPISPALIGDFNPFIFVNGDRGREVHLSDNAPTDLVNTSLLGTEADDSNPNSNRYYKSSNNLPWAIHIIHDFVYPKEKTEVILGYPYFSSWAESSGSNYVDWYKEKSGYRNYSYLKQN